ncbi:3-oxoadipate enol-lactonase [Mycobacterium sp. KBS0706]|uniref:3-oxoadipate enol-lactonase n=1 Tax=Mycobacterium sp. KBS0706 TaxID=2578109 RepID=UPI00110FA666|nr:3-oxoadipate enol-lactonase [Mycobacterium sp. KBS0706]TSD85908.1 3-oxoadipate enol-lactonase [Mycobacterium sp. KBS0706]
MDAVKANGIVLHVEDRGPRDAPALVFINSVGTDFRIWDAVVPRFQDHRTLRYDKRGHGLSGSEGGDSIEPHAADLAALLDARGIRRATIVGLSIGGMIALGLTRLRPDLVGRLILCDTAHKIGTAEAWQARIAAVEANGVASIAEATMERWFSTDFRARQPDLVAAARNMLSRTPADGYIRACAALRDADLTAAARAVAVPTLCLCGTADIATTPELVRSLAALIPGARYADIPGAGHIPCVEAPELLGGLIRDFIGNEDAHG